jgi:hypothetical protein
MGKNSDFNDVSGTPRELGLRLIDLIKTKKDGASGNSALPDRCRALIEAGANIETRDDKGMTPLLWAASNFRVKILQLLIDRGASALARDDTGMSALDHAIKKKSKPAIPLLEAAREAQLQELVKTGTRERVAVFKRPLTLQPRRDKSPV